MIVRWLVAGLTMALAAAPAAAIDLTGTWNLDYPVGAHRAVQITQTGTSVAVVLLPDGATGAGVFDEASRTLSASGTGFSIGAEVLPNGDWLLGSIGEPGGIASLWAHRCECVDGNEADGDGCDARCRVEPCFSCSGMPSTCAPASDGAACDDRADCTAGETCSGGACRGGAAVPACIDMTGWWEVQEHRNFGMVSGTAMAVVIQRDGVVSFGGGSVPWVGTIDTATGELNATWSDNSRCGVSTLTGVVAADGRSFSADYYVTGEVLFRCAFARGREVGIRISGCGDGTLDDGERCDDGNDVSGDGCDANCTPSGCGNGVRTGREVCDDGNAISGDGCDTNCRPTGCGNGLVSPGESCDDSYMLPGDGCDANCQIEPCWSCTGTEPSVCAPPAACARPSDPGRAKLVLRRSADAERNALGVRSGATDAVEAAALGDPRADADYQLCLFDRSGAKPKLLYRAEVPAGGTCGALPCWRDARGGFAYRNAAATPHGITKLFAVGDDRGRGSVSVVGRGAPLAPGLPSLPLPLPLEIQVQNTAPGGACWAVELPAAGVQRNDPRRGRFSGRGAP